MFLMNALYFKGEWTNRFDAGATAPAPFYLDDGTTVMVPMMHGDIKAKTMSNNGYFALELTYGRKNFSMIVILSNGNLNDFLETFNAEIWNTITTQLDNQQQGHVAVTLPKFSFEYEKSLNEQLKAMGMTEAFDIFDADLSGISDNKLYVDFVKQNTFIKVNEEGTEAGAVTTVGVNDMTAIVENFTVDKPFVFAIRETSTNTLLFIGKVMNPLEE
jgi:serpin B